MPGKRRFGRVRELPSGRWQARHRGPDGIDRPAPRTFDSKTSAERWLTLTEAEIIHGDWTDPDAGRVLFGKYASDWIEERPGLRPKTSELYRYLLRRHLGPVFDARPVAEIREPHVRRWRKDLLDDGVSAVTVAKAYRLLKAIFNTAVDDGLIRRNPCRIKGAGQEKSPERPVLTVPQVYALADAADERYRALVLLAAFTSLRWGELAALRRSDIDIQARTVRVFRQLNERRGGGFAFSPPKSEAGHRIVAIPELITPDLAAHIVTHARPGDDGLVFTSPGGGPLRHTNFRRRFWVPALRAAGFPPTHFHDLRHTGNMLAADAGANLRDLMDRMGHSTARAATVYLHGGDERQQAIADELSRRAVEQLGRPKTKSSGTQRARRRRPAS
jgi:integrase